MAEMYSFEKLAAILKGRILLQNSSLLFDSIAFDSRIITNGRASLFFAIQSKSHDGHAHLAECFLKGVRNFVVEKEDALKLLPSGATEECNMLLVKDSTRAMQMLAAHHTAQYQLPVIGITGSNGKTIVKEWLYELLKEDFQVVRSPKSYNSQIGVPFSVWQIQAEDTLGIFEAGISLPGEMEKLERVIQPSIGIFTNIGEAHQANFESQLAKGWEKMQLFQHVDALIYCKDYPVLQNIVNTGLAEGFFRDGMLPFSWSAHEEAELQISSIASKNGHSTLTGIYRGDEIQLYVPFADKASIENIIHCWALMLYLDYPTQKLQERIEHIHPIEMRLEIKSGINSSTVINDSYNSDLYALSIALDTLNQQQQHKTKTVILSDILQSGRTEDDLYKEVARLYKEKGISKFIGIGPALSRHKALFPKSAHFYPSTSDFLQRFDADSFRNEAILIKGSRSFGFELVAERLQQKAHTTVLEINLNALIHNLNIYRSLLKPETKIMAMVKAFSYGSGSYEIANVLQYHKTDYLAVAYADEAIYLRQNGIRMPILVMNPEEAAFRSMIEYHVEPEIYSLKLFKSFCQAFDSHYQKKEPFPIHIKLDTGMHRLGFEEEEIPVVIEMLKERPELHVQSVFTHLASTDVPQHDRFTRKQIRLFEKMSREIMKAIGYPVIRHALNSSGISRFPDAQFDMVRLGIGLYGIDPTEEVQSRLEEVSSLRTHISQIKHLETDETVGYSRKGKVKKPSSIATIGIGYADGFSRALGNGNGKVLVHGKLAPVIGNVCMDMTMIDITGIQAEEGDEVIVFGKGVPIQEMAKAMHTIAYEVLTNVSQRVKRVYYKE